jgi:hypothetical protein
LRSRQPRFATQARPAGSSSTISSAVRPDGKVSVAVRIQSGVLSGARFWKNGSLPAPSTKRLSAMGRPRTPVRAPSATARKYRTRSSFVCPACGKYTLSGLLIATSRSPIWRISFRVGMPRC